MNKKKLLIIDGNSLLHRAWHAIPNLTTKDGLMVNAVYGWMIIFFKAYKDIKPDFIAVTFDVKGGTFRDKLFLEYKAKRKKQPDELYAQIPLIKEILNSFGIKIFEKFGFEADDIIGTICKNKDVDNNLILSIILTGDMDTLQLVDENTNVYSPKKGLSELQKYDIEGVKERFEGLTPNQVIDFKALRGDVSDNIPGVKGIGEKTAIDLIQKYGSLENIYNVLENDISDLSSSHPITEGVINEKKEIKKRIVELLLNNKQEAFLSKKLVSIITDVNIDFNLENCAFVNYERKNVIEKLMKFDFKTLVSKLPILGDQDKNTNENQNNSSQTTLFETKKNNNSSITEQPLNKFVDFSNIKINPNYILVDTDEKFKIAFEKLKNYKLIVFDTETNSVDSRNCELLGISLCGEENLAWYILPKKEYLLQIKLLLEDEKIKKCGHNIKFDICVLEKYGIFVNNIFFDTMIASYLINPGFRGYSLDAVVFSYLGYEMIPIESLIGKGKTQITMDKVDINIVSQYSCEDADYTFRLIELLKKELVSRNCLKLFTEIEIPLIKVLFEMEKNGILVDVSFLKNLSNVFKKDLENIDLEIYKLAGSEFNINSPLQLKKILFNKLALPIDGLKKTKTGISTAFDELDKMRHIHPIIDLIIQHREFSKLISTYIDALPKQVDITGRIHTSFNQTIASTGRLSSSDPNLQNIPIRTEVGKKIRKAFVAQTGFKLVSADYSQIELRVIASLSSDKKMINAFLNGEDIHISTASSIFDCSINEVTKEQRYSAKAINFGVIYGLGAFGLARNVGISYEEAKSFIEKYFNVYSGVKNYLDSLKVFALKNGFVETLFGRRRYLPDINSGVPQIRANAERAAINAPVQGTSADLIKIAMIDVFNKLPTNFPQVKMLLQVHDELLFEVPINLVDDFSAWIKKTMENVYKLQVPIIVDIEVGDNWGELK